VDGEQVTLGRLSEGAQGRLLVVRASLDPLRGREVLIPSRREQASECAQ
jgi:hypothetical protein